MSRFTISRRTILRGIGGAAVALPPLEIMLPRGTRAAGAIPNRFLLACGGVALGGCGYLVPPEESIVVPRKTGPGYELTHGLKPIEGGPGWPVGDSSDQATYPSVKNDVGLVSGLSIPLGTDYPSCPPAGRFGPSFHGATTIQQTAGERSFPHEGDQFTPRGSSAEHLVGAAIGGMTPFPSIQVQVQASAYYSRDTGRGWSISARDGSPITPIVSLRELYKKLFSVGNVNGQTFDVAAFIDRRKSILDGVLEKSRRLHPRLGGEDRKRLDKYYTEVRALETSLEALKAKSGAMACKPPSAPPEPVINNDDMPHHPPDNPLAPAFASGDQGWSNEDLRAKIMCDFIHLALACDLTRSVLMEMTLMGGQMNACNITGHHILGDIHNVSHGIAGATEEDMADIVAWHIKHFSYLTAKLRDTVEADGSRLLDHCAMSLIWEAGHGPVGTGPHSSDNMMVTVAGGAGGLKSGQNINLGGKHPGQVVLTHMHAVGVPVEQPFGDLTGQHLPELFRIAS